MVRTGYHIVDVSPWPFCVAFRVLGLTSSLVGFFHFGFINVRVFCFLCSLFLLGIGIVRWWGDIVVERTFLGRHTKVVTRNLRLRILLFILSEVFFFVRFFWAFFNSMVGEISIGKVGHWPPLGISAISPWKVPALNTVVLVSSGVTVTWAHKAIRVHNKCPILVRRDLGLTELRKNERVEVRKRSLKFVKKYLKKWNLLSNENLNLAKLDDLKEAYVLKRRGLFFNRKKSFGELYWRITLVRLGATIALGIFFSWLQFGEYYIARFRFADGIYGSTYYIITGFHGVHVLVGTMFLIVCWFRVFFYHFRHNHHYFGLDAAIWYWHFVDIVWVALFGVVYIW